MDVGSNGSKADGSAEIDRELIGKLFSAGFLLLLYMMSSILIWALVSVLR